MIKVTRTYNAYHLGDNLVHLHFLRKVAQANPDRTFLHFAQWQYLRQLDDLIQDVPNLALSDFNYRIPEDAINAWRGHKGFWYTHPHRNDFVKFHVESWFPYLCERMKVENPIRTSEDMLFDYPLLKNSIPIQGFNDPFDVLLINSPPGSGQFLGYDEFLIGQMAIGMVNKGAKVISTHKINESGILCTSDIPMTVTGIGRLSLNCHTIVMVSTGPSWPTFNIWNQESIQSRIIMLTSEQVHLSRNTIHCKTVPDASQYLRDIGLL